MPTTITDRAAELYLDLLKDVLTRTTVPERYQPLAPPNGPVQRRRAQAQERLLSRWDLSVVRNVTVDPAKRAVGRTTSSPPVAS